MKKGSNDYGERIGFIVFLVLYGGNFGLYSLRKPFQLRFFIKTQGLPTHLKGFNYFGMRMHTTL